ncbi:MAG: hypothetical protein NT069_18930, partial [Planctomycetota bacterium]|nr:hypothetical protein [Planctomycetota bacterium]
MPVVLMSEQNVETPVVEAELPKSKSLFEDSELVAKSHVDAKAMEEFAYRPVPPLAPISMFLGICAIAGFLGVPALAIGIIGSLCGLLAMWQIRRSEGALGGALIAKLGLGLSLALTLGAGGYHGFTYATEVPEGHERVTFSWLSKQEMTIEGNDVLLPPAVIEMKEKPIFIKGYMVPSRQ